jgi:serine/threonine protein kinase
MPAPLDCPGLDGWQALFGDTIPPEQRERYERHLESCPVCQERLDGVEGAGDDLVRVVRQLGDWGPPAAEPSLAEVVKLLYEWKSPVRAAPAESPDLYFLRPTEEPGLLGLLGPYEVREVIGQGGMGVVLTAYEPALHRVVAIKVLSPALAGSATARQRFTREAQAAAAVCHEHIVAVHGVHESDGLPYLVMQFVPGESLQARLDRSGPLEVMETVRIGMQTAAGLAAAHAQGLIHRDIKPANLLLENGLAKIKITDFGLARMADDVGLTQNGVVAGTPEYMAPEQARGEAVDHRADLFSLGSVLYACCTGRPPFRGSTALAVLRRVSEEEPTPLRALNPDVPAWLEVLIMRLLTKDPARRVQSAHEVAALLAGYLAHLRQPATVPAPELPPPPHGDTPESPVDVAPRRAGWGFRFTAGLAVLSALLALGAGVALLLAGGEPGKPAPATRFHRDFRALDPNDESLRPVGEAGRPDDRGVRITLPAREGVIPHSGFRSGFGVQGDFEATFAFEVLKADTPEKGYGVGVSLYAALDPTTADAASLARRVMPDGQIQFISDRLLTVNGRLTHQVKTMPSVSAEGRLRLQRVGSRLHYLVADGPDAPFVELAEVEFGRGEVRPLQVGGNAGGSEAGLDFRLLSFTVTTEQDLPGLPGPTTPPAPGVRSKGWLAAAVLMALLVLGACTLALYIRRGRHGIHAPDPAANETAALTPAPPGVVFACAGCGKKLKVKAALAGRRAACPHCGRATHIPPAEDVC